MTDLDERLAGEWARRGALTARELAAALGVSQPTLSRAIARLGSQRVLRIGRGRATRYARLRSLANLGSGWTLYRVSEQGVAAPVGRLHALVAGQWFLDQAAPDDSLRGDEFRDGLFPGLPWFLQDLRPHGFLGRLFARRFGPALSAPSDPRLWSDDHVAEALLRFGDDLPGDFVLGDRALGAAGAAGAVVNERRKAVAYAMLAEVTLGGEWPGSSAAGEQPKFTVRLRATGGTVRQAIVKFSGDIRQPVGRRWADLLVAEHIANTVLSEGGIAVAGTRLVRARHRYFLESERFDRIGAQGRRGVVSLEALDAAHFGALETPWTEAADRLRAAGWITEADADRMRLLWAFGLFIGNTDMHYGNLSFFLGRRRPIALAPAYDMTPMRYRPDAEGRLYDGPPHVEPARPSVPTRPSAAALAERFWQRLAGDPRVSRSFRRIAARNTRTPAPPTAARRGGSG